MSRGVFEWLAQALQAGDMYRLKAILNLRPEAGFQGPQPYKAPAAQDFRKQEVEKKVSEEVLPPKPAVGALNPMPLALF